MIDWDNHPLPDRFRHHLSANNYFPMKALKHEPFNYPPLQDKIDWNKHFTDGKPPKYLDIGCGFGWFSIDFSFQAQGNILGIEVRQKAADYANGVIASEEIGNCSILWYSVLNGLDFLEKESINQIFYFFPDPWFKKKHHKRRAFGAEFLQLCYDALEVGGELLLQTDIDEVQEYHLKVLEEFGKFDYKVVSLDEQWDYPTTNKEKDCIKNGFEYFRIRVTKNV